MSGAATGDQGRAQPGSSGPSTDRAAADPSDSVEEAEVAIVRFRVKECYLYSIPPASSIGHRAENWDVDNWLKALGLRVVSVGDKCFVRLYDMESEELFAECPLPDNHTLFHTAVDPVVDSSRYFALKIVDSESGRHAFVGIGFRERSQASDFNAALDDHRSFLRRQQEASKLVHEREEAEHQHGGPPGKDLSIKGTIHIDMHKLDLGLKPEKGFLRDRMMSFSAVDAQGLLPPPPSASTSGSNGFWKAFDENTGVESAPGPEAATAAPPNSSTLPTCDAEDADDSWGDFQG